MALSSSSRPALRGRVLSRLPATLQATGGLTVEKVAGVWTFAPDWTVLAVETTIPDPEARQLWALNPDTGVYTRLSVQALIDSLPEGPTGDAATIAVGTVTTLTPGSSATVVNAGTSGAAIFNFGIPQGAAGTGDVVGPAASIDGEIALYNSTTGKLIKRASLTGLVKATSGVASAATAGTDYLAPPSGSALMKANAGSALASAVAGTDYLAPAAIGTTVQAYDAQLSSLIRQNSQSAAYGLVLTDGGKHIFHPSADTTPRTFTIPANSSVAYPIGTALTFVNQNSAGSLTIAITTDTMRLAGAGTTGSRTLAANGVATALKVTSTEWIISGTGLT